ncbi:aminotransferase class I/II-fold pyridoxal phosphate-dependent enzyme [Pseudoalteromonas sp. OOF1S-7]|uniref:pyridoxal phosphate-dependent decarboxylase family protein n=1 Tax=Pseudoalteromonas sp. OOF1S-7 TaxID=2917757 RepID=UPI001EF6CCFB|nr:aminotransferase class I/II-fold pyridoxal phosphate-dependent enzyme [Pseudoalteromonas sp. OOF1S-7]MCG7534287.1 aminotransferase class I/II-fold pyridoxal phosphate-dependent enzyme [Pseudoalteromonas sp. OOF1S-7]
MHALTPRQLPAYEQLLAALEQECYAFRESLGTRRVSNPESCLQARELVEQPAGFEVFRQVFSTEIAPQLSASNGGRYWGFVTGGANPVATYADWLVTLYNQNVSKGGDSIASQVERQAIKWITELFELPAAYEGVMTTGATAANVLGAMTARQEVGLKQGVDVAKAGCKALDYTVFAATPHASMVKALGLAGLGQESWVQIACESNSEAMDTTDLANKLNECHSQGKIVIASAATVTGTDFDDLVRVAQLCRKHQAWLHVDGAFGIFERLLTGSQGKTQGIELADSITLDCHKWLNVPYDCGVFLTRHPHSLFATCNADAPYLVNDETEQPFMSLGIENSRRFRALPVWATLLAYGKQGIKSQIQRNVDQANVLASWLNNSPAYELDKPCELNVVVFSASDKNKLDTHDLLAQLNEAGQVFMTPGVWQGKAVIRCAFSNWCTEMKDVELAIAELSRLAS